MPKLVLYGIKRAGEAIPRISPGHRGGERCFRATLMSPVYGDPIDTAEEMFKEEKTPVIPMGLWQNYLKASNDLSIKRTGKFIYSL